MHDPQDRTPLTVGTVVLCFGEREDGGGNQGRQSHTRDPARRLHASQGCTWVEGRVCFNTSFAMPKMKTHSGAKKRFKKTATGKLRGRHGMTSHILEKKSPRRKRRLGRPVEIAKPDQKRVREMLGK